MLAFESALLEGGQLSARLAARVETGPASGTPLDEQALAKRAQRDPLRKMAFLIAPVVLGLANEGSFQGSRDFLHIVTAVGAT